MRYITNIIYITLICVLVTVFKEILKIKYTQVENLITQSLSPVNFQYTPIKLQLKFLESVDTLPHVTYFVSLYS